MGLPRYFQKRKFPTRSGTEGTRDIAPKRERFHLPSRSTILGLRDDKDPREVIREKAVNAEGRARRPADLKFPLEGYSFSQ